MQQMGLVMLQKNRGEIECTFIRVMKPNWRSSTAKCNGFPELRKGLKRIAFAFFSNRLFQLQIAHLTESIMKCCCALKMKPAIWFRQWRLFPQRNATTLCTRLI